MSETSAKLLAMVGMNPDGSCPTVRPRVCTVRKTHPAPAVTPTAWDPFHASYPDVIGDVIC